MRALVITPLPLPDPSLHLHGVFLRLKLFLQAIGRFCSQVEVVHFVSPRELELHKSGMLEAELSRFWGTPVTLNLIALNAQPRSWRQAAGAPFRLSARGDFRPFLGKAQKDALNRVLLAPADLIFAHRLPVMVALAGLPARAPVFFDLDDVEHQVKLRAARTAAHFASAWRHRMEAVALREAERAALRSATRTFVCSDHDIGLLAACGMDVARTVPIHNAVAVPAKPQPLAHAKTILFLGNYGHAPNAQAADRLISRIWPLLQQSTCQASLIIAGASPERIPAYARRPEGVEFTGVVPDLASLYASIRVVCCPIDNGGGTRIKLIEAAGYGKAIVATKIGAEGLALEPGRDMLLAETDEQIAAACLRLLNDDELARSISAAAAAVARASYRLGDVVERIEREILAALATGPGANIMDRQRAAGKRTMARAAFAGDQGSEAS